jgi:hypothetical protein
MARVIERFFLNLDLPQYLLFAARILAAVNFLFFGSPD